MATKDTLLSLLLMIAVSLSGVQECTANLQLYIKPSNSSSNITSLTLEQVKRHSSALLPVGGNVTLVLLEGVHTLISQQSGFMNLDSLTIEPAPSQRAVIQFLNDGFIKIDNVSTVTIQHVHFLSIKRSVIQISTAGNFVMLDTTIDHCDVKLKAGSQKEINVTFGNCFFAYGSIQIGNKISSRHMIFDINNCTFKKSISSAVEFKHTALENHFRNLSINFTKVQILETKRSFDAIRIYLSPNDLRSTVFATISDSLIVNSGNGISVRVQTRIQEITLFLVNTTIRNQKIQAFHISSYSKLIRISLNNCTLDNSRYGLMIRASSDVKLTNGTVWLCIHNTTVSNFREAGMIIGSTARHSIKLNITNCTVTENKNTGIIIKAKMTTIQHIVIQNTTFSSNQNGALFVRSEIDCQCSTVIIYNCTVEHNHLISVANRAIGPQKSSAGITLWFVQEKTNVLIERVVFNRNHDLSPYPVIFQVIQSKQVTIKNCEFIGNKGSAVQAHFSRITFSGYNVFIQNRALHGGALSLLHSRMVLPNNSRIDFIENKAERVGGAVFVRGLPKFDRVEETEQCFYQLPLIETIKDLTYFNSSVSFLNNTAEVGGEDIYGAPLRYKCFVSDKRSVRSHDIATSNVFRFHSSPKEYSSSISSDPQRVCLCNKDGIPQCENISYIVQEHTRFPGEKFNVSAVLVGDEYGTVSGVVYATLLGGSPHLDRRYQTQEVSFKKCNSLQYSINASPTHWESLILTANKETFNDPLDVQKLKNLLKSESQQRVINLNLLSQPILINITLEDCPVGFQLDSRTQSCECSEELRRFGIDNCEIINRTGMIHREGAFWITSWPNRTGVVVHIHCPFHYCKVESIPVNPALPDTQCALNHSGTLCGGCAANLSLTIGSNRCLLCQNNHRLFLLLFFISSGFLLVFFIKILDLTVTRGTINGLVFYANIAWAYKSLLFPSEIANYPFLQFLNVFLAWLNLDFGIETCFVMGLTAYWKTWLQWIFPVYVWIIVGFMILLSHYSTKVTNLLGNNTVPVLATLFLLSYAKLVRTIITVVGLSALRYHGDIICVVWAFDGNLTYFGLKHSFLMLVAVFAALFLWIPYVFTLIAVPFLKRKSHLRCLRWINSWKPFYDAYFGPFKDKHHYWCGLLLLVRGGLLLLFSIASTSYPNPTIFVMTLTSTLILLYVSLMENVYKNRLLGWSENFALANLIFLGSGILCFSESKAVIVQISIALAFVHFVGIVIIHFCRKLGVWCQKKTEAPAWPWSRPSDFDNSWMASLDRLREGLLEETM